MRYAVLENGMIIDKETAATMPDGTVIIASFRDDGTLGITKVKTICEDNDLRMAEQKLIEHCEGKSKAEIAFWVANMKQKVAIGAIERKIKRKGVDKDDMIMELIELNEINLSCCPRFEIEVEERDDGKLIGIKQKKGL